MKQLELENYTYNLPEDRIAEFPLARRDESNLLIYENSRISHEKFFSLPDALPADATLFFNNTKVLPARLIFHKATGARIEIFLLEPVAPTADVASAMVNTDEVTWRCMIGNLKKWKGDVLSLSLESEQGNYKLYAYLSDRENGLVRLQWTSDAPFASVVRAAGQLPLPPYIKRKAEASDYERYQTVYARFDGAVAAPTAGLHFTPNVLKRLKENGVKMDELTLHVSAGTFQPIKSANIADHKMHSEEIVIKRENINQLLAAGKRIAVGTTSMRTMESLYWFGARLVLNAKAPFLVGQNDPYEIPAVSLVESLEAVINRMDDENTDFLTGRTEIFIYPGYTFRVCNGLITNFHLPGSTLILLVAAFIGEDWKKVYEDALAMNYRFLSYGDSSLLLPEQ